MSESKPLLIAGFAGSLRKGSYNRMLLYAVLELLPRNARLEILDLGIIPLFNQDLEYDMPVAVKEFRRRLRRPMRFS